MPLAPVTIPVTIAASQSVSPVVDLAGLVLCGVFFPAAMTGTTVTVTASPTAAGAFGGVYDSAGVVVPAVTFGANRFQAFNPQTFLGVQFVKLTSNGTEAAERIVTLVTRPG
jgi:hypothetical protein